ncbi:MAG: nucleotide exchange factor GrpE, partial [Firmicutes bacterium]|nr:nucleotide exchange factor GrpE [Bacillota bacterium]
MTSKPHDECAEQLSREQQERCPGQEVGLEEAQAKAAENWDLYLRARADLENYQRRVARDLDYNIRCGKRDLILRILGVVDDMERALAADADYESLHS